MKRENEKKLYVRFLVALISILGIIIGGTIGAKAETIYNSQAAISFASETWNSHTEWLCAEFVARALNAGGVSVFSRSCTELHRQLLNSGLGYEYEISVCDGKIIQKTDQEIYPGDVVFYYCETCTDQRPYIHCVLANGTTENGTLKAFSHNNANSGQGVYQYSHYSYCCGTPVTKAFVFTFYGNEEKQESEFLGELEWAINNEDGTITLSGWAADKLDPNVIQELEVIINDEVHYILADGEREDIEMQGVGVFHGFCERIKTDERGSCTIHIYGKDGLGNEVLIGNASIYISDERLSWVDEESIRIGVGGEESVTLHWSVPANYIFPTSDFSFATMEYGQFGENYDSLEVTFNGEEPGVSIYNFCFTDNFGNKLAETQVVVHVLP